ncbi:hypothetical protein [Gardnerella vaginalis]|uniref:hypothetical protein n=1 Tax=Gardnerella vaginalis TaxID=2702 RepID=UPI0039EFA5C9
MRKNGRNFTAARSLCRLREQYRQKLYVRVKKKSATSEKTTKTLQRRAVYAASQLDSYQNFTRALNRSAQANRRALLQSIENVENIGWFGVFDGFVARFVYFTK